MKSLFLWISCLLVLVGASFTAGRFWKEGTGLQTLQKETTNVGDNGFRPAEFPLTNQSFVVFVCGFNNGALVEKSLHSIFSQVYGSYRLIYIDDASTDQSFVAAHDYILESGQMDRTTFLQNEKRLGLLANLVRAVEMCRDREILVVLDGVDWFAHEWVLNRLNQYYADPDLWMAYGQFREPPLYHLYSNSVGSSESMHKGVSPRFRDRALGPFHGQTFYAALFKRIVSEDLSFRGEYVAQRADLAMMLPMLEMAQGHYQFIPETLFLAERRSLDKNEREEQLQCEKHLRALKPYVPMLSLFSENGP